ncbi:hypothetical protein OPV22_017055 [Ensete ventricosum]|uniref:Uncharacterized protein n=1 Tax=Ensete ventricosum TaxID=4639 RepID=A0AAV8PEW1_ENSVE|nr:hypothetical protein OPV22_017055 [Ensete ventricosum]
MAPNELKLTGDMGFRPPVAPPFVTGSTQGERECKRFQGLAEGHGSHGDRRSNREGKEEEAGDGHVHGKERQHRPCARGHWRPDEDAKLKELVSQHGPQNWNLIAEKLEGRSGKSCRLRWFNQLDPRISRDSFSEEEEERLLAAHRLYGNKWALIARLFPGRTDNAVKNLWHVIMARKQREQSNAYRRRRPSSASSSISPLTHSLPNRKEVNPSNNACSGESTITSTRDESASTCADLSLGSFTSRIVPSFPNGYSPSSHQPHSYQTFRGSDGKVVTTSTRIYEKHGGDSGGSFFSHGVPRMLAPGFNQSDCTGTGSASGASADEAVVYRMTNTLHHGETEHGGEKLRLPFFDFLGVGAT